MTEFDSLGKARDDVERRSASRGWRPGLREGALFNRDVIHEIQRAAREGIYDIRGFGAKRRLPHFDDLLVLGASISRYPLEGYRERCDTNVTLGTRYASKPLELRIPITIAGMSFGALSAPAKEALGRGATEVGTSTTTGDGGMTPEEREHSETLVYQLLPSRYGMNPDDLRRADAIEVVVGQGAKPGGGGMLLGHKISDRVAEMRDLPKGIDQRSASRHPDWTGPDDLEIKLHELREITDWEKPIFVKVGATRTYYDVQLAVKAGADVIVLDGMQGGTAATQDVFIEHVGIPTLPAVKLAVDALQELDMHRKVQLVVSGGIRTGADVAKALALGADAVSIGVAALIALGDNAPELEEEYRAIGSAAGFYDDWQAGRDPAGISTQDDELSARLDPVLGGRRIANYLRVLTLEAQTLARACGKSHVHNLEPEDLVALTVEAAAMARVPLAGTDWIPGRHSA
jgi:glutamate synthase domain-containing protein 2